MCINDTPSRRRHLPKDYVAFEQTMRWYGPRDPVALADLLQAGCTGVVTALHHVPNGEVWTIEEIRKRQEAVRAAGMEWSVVESIPVHEDIRKGLPGHGRLVDAYCESLRNLSRCGIRVVTYNFMPALDWTRTHLSWEFRDGSRAVMLERAALIGFDVFLLKRPGAAGDYSADELARAETRLAGMNAGERQALIDAIIKGLPGSEESFTLNQFQGVLDGYRGIDASRLRGNLAAFIARIAPVAQECGVRLAIHPDDPPYPLFGLPRVVSTAEDVRALLAASDLPANGLCFCTGSFGVRADNDLPAMAREFGDRVHFIHLRNTTRNEAGDFWEDNHLEGDTDMYAVMRELVAAMQRRRQPIPLRPDHGHQMLDDLRKPVTNPGYSAIGRLRGLAELRGLEMAIARAHFA